LLGVSTGASTVETPLANTEEGKVFGSRVEPWNIPSRGVAIGNGSCFHSGKLCTPPPFSVQRDSTYGTFRISCIAASGEIMSGRFTWQNTESADVSSALCLAKHSPLAALRPHKRFSVSHAAISLPTVATIN